VTGDSGNEAPLSTLTLSCLILGDNPIKIFTVQILTNAAVTNLRNVIKEELTPALEHVPVNDLMI
jgi:hypothetical protein